ncbi:MAG TPA: HIT family hydrolase [Actinobacteria bacterium]|nr:HIT family hydrolase [Actinomycetota bacterium]
MERLWTPWRMEYIQSVHEPNEGCFLCQAPEAEDEAAALVLARTERAYALLNAYPYNPGHTMVAPLRHTGEFGSLSQQELADCMSLLQRVIAAISESAGPNGFNVGMNLGRVAGAGTPDHLHWHVVPRWSGDVNMMTIFGDTRVLPELLAETYAKLQPLL